MGDKTKDASDIFEEAMKAESEASDNEDLKLGSGGAATTGYNMNRKNANAKIRDLTNSENKNNLKEILDLLSTLLSIDIKKDQLSEEESKCKAVLTDLTVQSNLGTFGSNFLSSFIGLQSCSSSNSRNSSSLENHQRSLEIINKIVRLLNPEVLASTINPKIISRQLRSFLLSSNGYASNKSHQSYIMRSEENAELKYIYSNLSLIKTLLEKTDKESIDFKVPMIREGILDTINDICKLCGILNEKGELKQEENKDKSSLPSIAYITSQISSSQNPPNIPVPNEEKKEDIPDLSNPLERLKLLKSGRFGQLGQVRKSKTSIYQKILNKILPYIK